MPRRRTHRRSGTRNRRNKRTTRPRTRRRTPRAKRRTQRGGFVPACIPCIAAAAPAAKIAAATAAGAGIWAAKHFSGFSHKSSSSRTMENGREKLKRTETYEIQTKNGETKEKKFTQDGKELNLAGKKSTASSVKEATAKFNAAVKRCIKSGFKKC
tara:strand:+ start:3408 stop:3875 length:468 start_codon:yes stop_codon:yes gene_type:complete